MKKNPKRRYLVIVVKQYFKPMKSKDGQTEDNLCLTSFINIFKGLRSF